MDRRFAQSRKSTYCKSMKSGMWESPWWIRSDLPTNNGNKLQNTVNMNAIDIFSIFLYLDGFERIYNKGQNYDITYGFLSFHKILFLICLGPLMITAWN